MTGPASAAGCWGSGASAIKQVDVAKRGYQPVAKLVKIVKGTTVTTNFALTPDPSS